MKLVLILDIGGVILMAASYLLYFEFPKSRRQVVVHAASWLLGGIGGTALLLGMLGHAAIHGIRNTMIGVVIIIAGTAALCLLVRRFQHHKAH